MAENAAVFHGWKAAGIAGILEASPHDAIALGEDCERYPRHVAKAVDALLAAGVDGPYGLALGPEAHTRVLETSEHGGYPLLEHLREILGGPLVWAPGVQGAAVLSLRGGDFLLRVRRGPLDRLREPRRRRGPSLPRGELQLPRRHPRGGGRAHLGGFGETRHAVLGARMQSYAILGTPRLRPGYPTLFLSPMLASD